MFFLRWLNAIGCRGAASASEGRTGIRPALESLEDRITPTSPFETYINASVQIIPNLSNFTVTEKVTANVNYLLSGPLPKLSAPVTFLLNNQQQSAYLNSNGQATVTYTLPLATLLTSQILQVAYPPHYNGNPNMPFDTLGSVFLAPLYTNFDNLFLPSTLTFGTLTEGTGGQMEAHNLPNSFVLSSFNTIQGETDDMGPLSFAYSDPGIITSFNVFGFTLPGFLALAVGAYGPEFMPNGGSS